MSYPGHENRKKTPIHDEIQISLATANEEMLKNLIMNCQPPICRPETFFPNYKAEDLRNVSIEIDKISSEVEVILPGERKAADGVIVFKSYIKYETKVMKNNNYEWIKDEDSYNCVVLLEIKTDIQSFGDTLRQIKNIKRNFIK